MKNNIKSLIICLILAIFMSGVKIGFPTVRLKSNAQAVNKIQSSECVMERTTMRVLHGKNLDVKLPMASTTKILTAITVIENCDLEKLVEIPREAVGVEGSSIYLQQGEIISVEELLYGLMLRSGNDAAIALSLATCQSVDDFVALMNLTAQNIGAYNSCFKNPHGLSAKNHYTTARDLAQITCYALNNPIFAKIVSTKRITFGQRTFINKNKMLFNYQGGDGVKTGYTKEAGRCLVSSATKNNMQLVSVVLNCGPMFERSSELLDLAFSTYTMKTIIKKGEIIGALSVTGFLNKQYDLTMRLESDLTLPLSDDEFKGLKYVVKPAQKVTLPLKIGQDVGNLRVTANNELIFFFKLYNIKGVKNINKKTDEGIILGLAANENQ